ncbi:hypothetical protein [Prevotella lacticifex]|uniref:hypothetical protein n=1 Tax=Prevotella lacticifex TaxID=2854755 RepID=UPI001CC5351B|nr:hypothetical protein [Prevotella lacticifex]
MIANHGQRVLLSNKNKQNPCRDYSLSPSRKGRKGCAQQITKNAYSFPTKTRKTLAVMQGLRPLFLSGTVVLRSKLRPAGTRKKQPSFLRLASRQGKPEKPLMPRFLLWQRKSPTA